ncbi:MAG: SBBP repeat-containing protein [Bacteroidetes bacterium]|nr:SBBP repeat-containing protein [Bacteroidota bacterium]
MKKTLLIIFIIVSNRFVTQTLNLQWVKGIDCLNNDRVTSIKTDASNNVYTTGYFGTTSDFDPSNLTYTLSPIGQTDIFILKQDGSGNIQWVKSIGGISAEIGNSIDVDISGNVYVTGNFSGTVDFDPGSGVYNLTAVGADDAFILKLDASGNFLWAKQIGGSSTDYSYSLKINNGFVFIAGLFSGTTDFNPSAGSYTVTSYGSFDIFVAKFDLSGNFVWAKQMGGTSSDMARSLVLDAGGNIYVTGNFNGTGDFDPSSTSYNLSSNGQSDIFIAKLDVNGNFLWARDMGGSMGDIAFSIAIDMSNNVYTTGFYTGVANFDPASSSFTLSSVGGSVDIFILKLDALGNFIWAKGIGGTSGDIGNSIAVDPLGNVFTTGMFQGIADFNPGPGTATLSSVGGSKDIFISKLDPSGNYVWAQKFGDFGGDVGSSIYLNALGDIYSTGNYAYTVDFDPSLGVDTLSTQGYDNIYIVKFNEATVGLKENFDATNIKVYPNPTNGILDIESENFLTNKNVKIQVQNSLGQMIYSVTLDYQKAQIDLRFLNSGLYYLIMISDKKTETIKVIKN